MTRLLSIGEAIYRDGTSIQISKPDDWGWYYRNEEGDVAVIQVHKDFFGKWVKSVPYPDKQQNVAIKMDIHHVNETKGAEGLPKDVFATISKGNKIIETTFPLKRISVKGFFEGGQDVPFLEPESGYYPTLFIFMLGSMSNGKTCWLTSLGSGAVRRRVQRERTISYFHVLKSEIDKSGPTGHQEIPPFKPFFLYKSGNENKTIQAVVFIVDLGGEISNCRTTDPKVLILQDTIKRFASGIFVVRNAKWLFNQNNHEINRYDPSEYILLHLAQEPDNAFSEDKFCYILTGADILKKDIESKKEIDEELNLTSGSPIFKQAENTEQMYENMAIASYIMKTRDGSIGDSPCFAVSSGCATKDEQGNPGLDYRQSYNADLPIIYMLQRLIKI